MKDQEIKFIDVMGEGQYYESAHLYIVEIVLTITSIQKDTALTELEKLRKRCVDQLVLSGIEPREIRDGGKKSNKDVHRQVYRIQASHKLIIYCEEIERLSMALIKIEKVAENDEQTVDIRMKQPLFKTDPELIKTAQNQAYDHAKQKAEIIVNRAGLKLGNVLQIQELVTAKRDSGMLGDEDW